MIENPITTAAKALIEALDRGEIAGRLMPFGDGPLELTVARKFTAEAEAAGFQISAVVSKAVELTLADVLGSEVSVGKLYRLGNLAFVARFAGVVLKGPILSIVLSKLEDFSDLPGGQEALGDFLRTVARERLEVVGYEARLPQDASRSLLAAYAEFYVASMDPRIFDLIDILNYVGGDDLLLWNLMQLDRFATLIAEHNNLEDLQEALLKAAMAIDDNHDVFVAFVMKVKDLGSNGFDGFDYRLEIAA